MLLLRPQVLLRDVLNGRSFAGEAFLARHPAWQKAGRAMRAFGRWLAGRTYGGTLSPFLPKRPRAEYPVPPDLDDPGTRRLRRGFDDPEAGSASPEAGKPAPLRPRPGHHLVAAKALPPGDDTYLLPKD